MRLNILFLAWLFPFAELPALAQQLPSCLSETSSFQSNLSGSIELESIGDINGDGYGDMLLWAVGSSIHVYTGSDIGIASEPFSLEYSSRVNAVAGIGDINSDGFDDVGVVSEESINIHLGSANGLSSTAAVQLLLRGTWYNYSNYYREKFISGTGDVNGDGNDDFVVAVPAFLDVEVYFIAGSTGGGKLETTFMLRQKNYFQNWVSKAGDVNNDQYADVLINQNVYYGSASGIDLHHFTELEPAVSFSDVFSMSNAGDVNGDGYDDIITGYFWDENELVSNGIGLHYGSSTGISSIANFKVVNQKGTRNNRYGRYVEGIGDINNDGYSDFIVLANGQGESRVFYGSSSAPVETGNLWLGNVPEIVAGEVDYNSDSYLDMIGVENDRVLLYEGSAEEFKSVYKCFVRETPIKKYDGELLEPVGDINKDGFDDLLTSYWDTEPLIPGGAAFLYKGSKQELLTAVTWELYEYYFNTGETLSGTGDINGDGFNDFIISSAGHGNGRVDIWFGNIRAVKDLPDQTLNGDNTENQFGVHVQPAGDINSDGYSDVIIGGLETYLFYGSAHGLDTLSELKLKGPAFPLGDINGDLFPDLAIVVDNKTYIYPGSSSGLSPDHKFTYPGIVIGRSGDVNGDGFSDVFFQSDDRFTLFLGSREGLKESSWYFEGLHSATLGGDFNSDGYADAIITKPFTFMGEKNEGTLAVFLGSRTGLNKNSSWVAGNVFEPLYNAKFAGDLNGDNFTDIVAYLGDYEFVYFNGHMIKEEEPIECKWRVSIPNAYVVNSKQSAPNTIYLGYNNNTIRLSAYATGGVAPYAYKWSTGDTTRYLRVRREVEGSFEYSVIITDSRGCSLTATTTVNVVNALCPNPLKDLVSKYFPWLMKEPIIQSLIQASAKVRVCEKDTLICASLSQLGSLIKGGAMIGKCNTNTLITSSRINQKKKDDDEQLSIIVSPNPSSAQFVMQVNGNINGGYFVRILDAKGSEFHRTERKHQRTISFGQGLTPGYYYIVVTTGKGKAVQRVIRQ